MQSDWFNIFLLRLTNQFLLKFLRLCTLGKLPNCLPCLEKVLTKIKWDPCVVKTIQPVITLISSCFMSSMHSLPHVLFLDPILNVDCQREDFFSLASQNRNITDFVKRISFTMMQNKWVIVEF